VYAKVLITGGTGSLGKALIRRLDAEKIIVFSRDEFKQSEMAKSCPGNTRFFLGDVRDRQRLKEVFSGVDIVIHAAALKQVPALEYNPTEAVKTNILGSQNVIAACIESGVKKCILISTDKAVNPVNLYGSTKLTAEKLFMAANAFNKTKFSCVRYGNVIGSRGSVIPLFEKLRRKGVKEFPVTSREMTRFWLTLDEAVDLVFFAIDHKATGIFVPDVPSMSIVDIARSIDPDCLIKEIGIRDGEKVHEVLVSEDNKFVGLVTNNKVIWHPPVFSSKDCRKMTREEFLGKL